MIVLLDKNFSEISLMSKKSVFLPLQNQGLVAEWLGTGLQNR